MADNPLVLQVLMEIKSDLGRLEGKVDGIDTAVTKHLVDDGKFHDQSSGRLGALERRASYEKGVVVAASVVISFAAQWVAKQLGISTPGG